MKQGKIKMVALMPHNVQNIVWYSYPTTDRQLSRKVCIDMYRRFQKRPLFVHANVIQFYENGQVLFQFNNKFYNPNQTQNDTHTHQTQTNQAKF